VASQEDIESQLISIVRQLLVESNSAYGQRKISLDLSLERHLGMDSITRAELHRRIEKGFGIHLSVQLVAQAETLNDIKRAIGASSIAHLSRPVANEYHHHVAGKMADVSHVKTLVEVLMVHTNKTPEQMHIYYIDENDNHESVSYQKLLSSSLRIANSLIRRGLKPGDTVAIMLPTKPEFFYTFFGVLLARGVPVPIYPPFRRYQLEAYVQQEAKILGNASVRILVTFEQAQRLSQSLSSFVPSLKEVVTTEMLVKEQDTPLDLVAMAEDPALIQYTSGSTSAPKGVFLTNNNLLSNIRAFGRAIGFSADDIVVSWLPLYHDLGLIGNWLGSLYHGAPLILFSPLTFLTRPEKWLWTIHYHRATLSAGPNFAYELCVRKIEPAKIEGLDLSCWRLAVNGAEAILPKTLERFSLKFAPYGFKKSSILPVYGLAENTVGLTIPPINRGPLIDIIERHAFENQKHAIEIKAHDKRETMEFVSCGKPLEGHEIRIVNNHDEILPERHVGFLQFRGPSSMKGYYNNALATTEVYHNGWWDSGDLAYIAHGEVFIVGRTKDTIKKAGRNLYPSEMEELTAEIPGVRGGAVVAFGISDKEQGTEKVIIVAETAIIDGEKKHLLKDDISEKISRILDIVPDQIVLLPPRSIPKTSSGKLQRSLCKAMYLEGKLTRHRSPIWLQVAKFSVNTVALKAYHLFNNILKLLYTLYLVFFTSFGVLITWIAVKITPKNAARIAKLISGALFMLGFCPIIIRNKYNLSTVQPMIFVANHSSYVDAILLTGILPTFTRFIAKQELFSTNVLKDILKGLKHLSVNRLDFYHGLEDTKKIEAILKEGESILVFPEGTFSYASGLRPFKLGAFKMAADTNIAICPIAIKGTRKILRDGTYLLRPGKIEITVGEPIFAKGKEWQDVMDIKNQVREFMLKYCGEPSLDFIVANKVAGLKPSNNTQDKEYS